MHSIPKPGQSLKGELVNIQQPSNLLFFRGKFVQARSARANNGPGAGRAPGPRAERTGHLFQTPDTSHLQPAV